MNVFLLISISYNKEKDRISTKSLSGIYTSLENAKASIMEYPDSISEAGYFNYILIEKRELNVLEARSIEEHWFQFVNVGADELLVEAIEKPKPFVSLFNFV